MMVECWNCAEGEAWITRGVGQCYNCGEVIEVERDMEKLKVISEPGDMPLVMTYSEGYMGDFGLSDLSDQIVIDADVVPALIKELKKFHKRAKVHAD